MTQFTRLMPFALAGFITASATAASPCSYDAEILWGPTCGIFGPTVLYVADIAEDGTIVGWYQNCADLNADEGFVWSDADAFTIPRPQGVETLVAHAINNVGQVAVSMHYSAIATFGNLAHIYNLFDDSFFPLGTPPGGNYSIPYGINDDGHVVGEWGNNLIGPSIKAFLWDGFPITDLTPLLSGPKAIAFDISNAGQVVGWTGTSQLSSTHIAFLWQDSKVTELGPVPGGTSSSARGINDLSQIAVSGGVPNPSGPGIVGQPFLWQNGKWIELGVLPGYTSCNARDINDSSQIIGSCTNPDTTDPSWYLWQDGMMTDLSQLIPAKSGDIEFEIDTLVAINNAGQLAAYGIAWHPFYGSSQVGLRLTPKFHSPADFTGDCHVDSKDLGILLGSWGPVGKRNGNPAADLDGNGIVNGYDLAILLAAWG